MSISRYILPFILVILSGLMYVLYIDPTYTEILSLRDKKVDYETAINNAGEVRDLQAKLLAEVEAIDQDDRERLEKLLPATQDPILVLYDLNVFAQKHGLVLRAPIVTIPPPDVKTAQTVTPVLMGFGISAPYAVFRTFVADMERDLALKDIKKVSILGDSSAESALESSVFTYQMEVEGHAYQGREKTKAAPAATP